MDRIPRGKYTKEFRLEAVKLVVEEKLSAAEAGAFGSYGGLIG